MKATDIITESHQACPHCGGPLVEYSGLMEKKDACYYKVKASAKVWPSAYASGRLVQCRKKGAGNYGNKSESVSEGEKDTSRMNKQHQDLSGISTDKIKKHNVAVAKLPGGQAHRSNHPDLLKRAPKGYSFSVSHKLVPDEQGVSEGVAETVEMYQAIKVLRHYGADHFKTTTNELHFYKNGRPMSVDLIFNDDATRSVSLSQLNSATRQLKGQGVAEGYDEWNARELEKSRTRHPDGTGSTPSKTLAKLMRIPGFSKVSPAEQQRVAKAVDGYLARDMSFDQALVLAQKQGVAEAQLDEKCWDGYQQQGMKNKSGRQVPNCVPTESVAEAANPAQQAAIAIAKKKKQGVSEDADQAQATRRIQKMLNTKYHANLDIDGVLGPLTLASINKFMPDSDSALADDPGRTSAVQGSQDKDVSEDDQIDTEIEEMYEAMDQLAEEIAAKQGVSVDLVWESFEALDDHMLFETAAWRRSAGKSKKGGLNAKGVASYRRENPGSKLQMAVTTKPSKLKKGSKAAKRRKSFCARMGGVKGPMKKPNGKPTRKALALRKWNC